MLRRVWLVVSALAGCGGEGARPEGAEGVATEAPTEPATPSEAASDTDVAIADLLGEGTAGTAMPLGMRGEGVQNGGPTYPSLADLPVGGKGTSILASQAAASKAANLRLAWEAVVVEGGLPRAVVEAVVRRNAAEVRYCFSRALARDPALGERALTVRFALGPDGISGVTATPAEDFGTPSVPACVLGRFRAWEWPPAETPGTVTVALRFTQDTAP
ncbi:MAG: AgmX/PglI C-terminal domain-containing protein [Myxococcota bacterium]